MGSGDRRYQARRSAVVARSRRRRAQAGQHLVRRPDLHSRRAAGGVRRQPATSQKVRWTYKGLNKIYTFNPFNETWTEQPDMRHGRWYPTGVRMADGRIAIISGLDESGGRFQAQRRRRTVHTLCRPQRSRNGGLARHAPQTGRAKTCARRSLPAHVRDAVAAEPWWRDRSRGHLVPRPRGPFELLQLRTIPNMPTDRLWGTAVLMPGGTGGSTQVMQLGGSTTTLHPLGGHNRDLRRGKPGGGLAGKVVDAGPARPPQHRAVARRLDGHSRRRRGREGRRPVGR